MRPAPAADALGAACSMETNKQEFFTEWEESFDSFDQMGLHENLLRGIYAYGEGAGGLGRGAAAGPAGRPRAAARPRSGARMGV